MARAITIWILSLLAFGVSSQPASSARPEGPSPEGPNIVLIFADDLAWADLGCYGNPRARTPNLDQMAREGIRFTDFYVGQPVCSASRAALMTGCYPGRVGIQGALGPNSKIGINDKEVLLPQVLKPRGYATAIYGKW